MEGESTDDDVVAIRARMKPEERLRRRREIVAIHKREWHLSIKQIADYPGLPARYVEQTLQEAGRIPKAGRGGIEDQETPLREAATDPSGSPPSPSTPRPSG